MTAISVSAPFPILTDIDGDPLDAGYVYIGQQNLDPVAFPKSVYWDASLTTPAAQPIRTSGGYPVRNGSPARIYTDGDYSISINNKNGALVYSSPAATDRMDSAFVGYDGGTVQDVLDAVTGPSGAASVGYTPAGAGAVATTVKQVLDESVSVFRFMTTAQIADVRAGTALVDVTAAIMSAISQAKEVLLPPGKYLISTLSFLNDGVTLRGCGPSSHLYSTATTHAIAIGAGGAAKVSNITLKSFKLSGVYDSAHNATKGVRLYDCENVLIDDCGIENFRNAGVFSQLGNVCTFLRVTNNRLYNTGDFGVSCDGGDNILISSNIITKNEYVNYPPHSIYLKYDVKNVVIANNICRDCIGSNGHAIKLSGETATVVNASITGNTVEGCFGGVYLYHTQDVSVSGNVVKNNIDALPTKQAQGIELYGINGNVTVSGNVIDSTQGRGIVVNGFPAAGGNPQEKVSNFIATGNYVNVGTNALYCIYAEYAQFIGNILANNSSVTQYTTVFDNSTQITVGHNILKAGARHLQATFCAQMIVTGNSLIDNPITPVPDYALRIDGTCDSVIVNSNNAKNLSTGYIASSATNQSVFGNIGASANDTDRAVSIASAAPTTGTWRVGDVVKNKAPAEDGTAGSKYVITGWVCTVAGTPGTWTPMRSLTGN